MCGQGRNGAAWIVIDCLFVIWCNSVHCTGKDPQTGGVCRMREERQRLRDGNAWPKQPLAVLWPKPTCAKWNLQPAPTGAPGPISTWPHAPAEQRDAGRSCHFHVTSTSLLEGGWSRQVGRGEEWDALPGQPCNGTRQHVLPRLSWCQFVEEHNKLKCECKLRIQWRKSLFTAANWFFFFFFWQ